MIGKQSRSKAIKFWLGGFALLATLNGCLTTASGEPENATAPTITSQPQSVTVDLGATATFSVAATGSGTLAYQWQRNGIDIAGATTTRYTTPATVPGDDDARFRCVVTGSGGSATSAEAILTVNDPLPVITGQPQNATVAENGTATFTVAASGSGLSYQWRADGAAIQNSGTVLGATTATLTVKDVQANEGGIRFTCTVSNRAGSVLSDPAVLSVDVPVTTKSLNAGAQGNFNSFLDIDDMTDYTDAEIAAIGNDGEIDLFFGSGAAGSAIYSPDAAKNGIGGSSGFDIARNLSPARKTRIRVPATSVNFASIASKAQIDLLWAAATDDADGRLVIADGTIFMAESDLGTVVLIQVSDLVVGASGTVTLKGKTKF